MSVTRFHFAFAALASAGLLLGAGSAQADLIVQPTGATASSAYDGRTEAGAISGAGLSSSADVQTGDELPAVWPTHDTQSSRMWMSNAQKLPTITFDLGQSYDLSGMHVWNYNESGYPTRGIKDVTISFSETGVDGTFGNAQNFTLAAATGAGYAGEDYSFADGTTGQFVRFVVTSNQGDSGYTGLSEVRFFNVVPEPASLALLGVGSLLMVRRRRSAV